VEGLYMTKILPFPIHSNIMDCSKHQSCFWQASKAEFGSHHSASYSQSSSQHTSIITSYFYENQICASNQMILCYSSFSMEGIYELNIENPNSGLDGQSWGAIDLRNWHYSISSCVGHHPMHIPVRLCLPSTLTAKGTLNLLWMCRRQTQDE